MWKKKYYKSCELRSRGKGQSLTLQEEFHTHIHLNYVRIGFIFQIKEFIGSFELGFYKWGQLGVNA